MNWINKLVLCFALLLYLLLLLLLSGHLLRWFLLCHSLLFFIIIIGALCPFVVSTAICALFVITSSSTSPLWLVSVSRNQIINVCVCVLKYESKYVKMCVNMALTLSTQWWHYHSLVVRMCCLVLRSQAFRLLNERPFVGVADFSKILEQFKLVN